MRNILLFFIALGTLLICVGLSMNMNAEQQPTVTKYILDNCVNKTEFEPHGICLTVSNDYAIENPEWSVLVIYADNNPIGHAVNYRIIDDRLYVHDELWGWDYELEDWENMTIYHVSEGLNTITALYKIP